MQARSLFRESVLAQVPDTTKEVEELSQDPGKMSQGPDDQELEREYRQYTQGGQPGGRAARGPAVHAGGETEPQGLVPPYEGREKQARGVDGERPPQAGSENIMGSAGIRQTSEPPRNEPSSPESGDREAELNKNTGTDASADELKGRIENTYGEVEHGSSEGEPDPVTHENVHATQTEAEGRPRSGATDA